MYAGYPLSAFGQKSNGPVGLPRDPLIKPGQPLLIDKPSPGYDEMHQVGVEPVATPEKPDYDRSQQEYY